MKQKKPSFTSRIAGYFARHKGMFVLAVLFAVGASILQLYLPYMLGLIVDEIAGPGRVNMQRIGELALFMVLLTIGAGLMQWVVSFIANRMAFQVSSDIRKQAFTRLMQYPVSYYDRTSHGEIVSRLTNDVESISDGILQGVNQLFTGVTLIIGTFVLMLRLNLTITLIIVIITPFAFLVSYLIVKNSNKMFKRQQETVGALNGYAREFIDGQKAVRAYSLEQGSEAAFGEINDRLYDCGQKAQFYSSLINPATRMVNSIAYVCVGVVGGILVLTRPETMSVGLIAAFLAYALQFAKPINEVTNVTTQLQTAYVSFKRVFEVMDAEIERREPADMPKLSVPRGEIEFQNVSFAYDPARPLIENVSLLVRPGMKVAVVGPTGAGKTTLVNLLMRFYDITGGQILVDGTDIDSVTRDSLRAKFGMVLQETVLFHDTIRNNIAYGKPDATQEEIEQAARDAWAHGFIRRLPKGYDTVVSTEGGELSQGQKQLLTIARAMLLNPQILILDEATSSVDTVVEKRIQKAFQTMMQGRTSFVIAHRLSTIVDSDLILVMENGTIVETGTHAELLEQAGLYARLYHSQFSKN